MADRRAEPVSQNQVRQCEQHIQLDHINVLKAINLDEKLAKGTIRISLGVNNTVADVDAIAAALIKTQQ